MPTSRLLERGDEVEQIADALARVRAGTGQLVVVEGAAGVGKTELLRAAVRQAGAGGMLSLCGHGVELEREYAFGVATQLFTPLLRELGDRADDWFSGPADLVRPLLDGSLPSSGGDGDFPFLHGFFWLLGNLAESAPVVVALDDAQWSDAPSLRAVLYLVQRLDELPVCLVVAIRYGEPNISAHLLVQFVAYHGACVMRPAPLSRDAVARIIRTRFGLADQLFVDACAEVTGGNPFLLGELLAAVDADAVPRTSAGAVRVRELVPRQVLEATLVRLGRLGPDATSLARALAVLGGRSELRTMVALADVVPDAAAVAADALAAAGIVRQDPSPSFAHPLLRSAVYAGIGRAEQARMHAVAARILSDEGRDLPIVAAQLLAAAPGRNPWVVETLGRAARAAMAQGAPASAAQYLRRAVEEPPLAAVRGELLADLASAEIAAGEADGERDLRAALEINDDPERRVQLRVTLANALHHDGRHIDAAAVLEAGLAELDRADRELELELEAAWINVARLDATLRVPPCRGLRSSVAVCVARRRSSASCWPTRRAAGSSLASHGTRSANSCAARGAAAH